MEEEGACAHKSEVTRAIDATKTLQQKKERDASIYLGNFYVFWFDDMLYKWLRCSFSRANLGVVGNEMASEGGVPIGCQLSGTSARLVGSFGLVGWWAE